MDKTNYHPCMAQEPDNRAILSAVDREDTFLAATPMSSLTEKFLLGMSVGGRWAVALVCKNI